jgi:serine/threonine-protein kinase/endoribonuclease IRE1
MGLGKQLVGQSSYGASQTNSSLRMQSQGAVSSVIGARGTVGWQAPEVMALRGTTDSSVRSENSNRFIGDSTESPSPHECNGRTSRSVDIFSLGCVFYTTLVPGSHPFGEWYEREANIMHDRIDMQALRTISMEAYDLIALMLSRSPKLRPTAKEVCEHPYFWEQDRKLLFLCDVSDRIEMDGTSDQTSSLLLHVERSASNVIGLDWSQELDDDLVNNVQRFRSYNTSSVRDMLRLIRNKHHHFEELPTKLKASFVSSVGLIAYFESKFPKLLIHIYSVVRDSVPIDDILARKYAIKCTVKQKENGIVYFKDDVTTVFSGSSLECHPMSSLLEVDLVDESLDPNDQLVSSKTTTPNGNNCDGQLAVKGDDNEVMDCNANQPNPPVVNSTDTTTNTSICLEKQLSYSQGWYLQDNDWTTGVCTRRDQNLLKCLEDNKFRTRLCNHWDLSFGTVCPLRKKGKCIFAHGPIELRVKDGKRVRWGKLVDVDGNCKNPNHSGGEDTYGAARSIETERKEEGKWNTKSSNNNNNQGKKKSSGKSNKKPSVTSATTTAA